MTGFDKAASELYGSHTLTGRERKVLRSFLIVWPTLSLPGDIEGVRQALTNGIHEQYKKDYGFVLTTLIIGALISGVVSWLVERILDRLFPNKAFGGGFKNMNFANVLTSWSNTLDS